MNNKHPYTYYILLLLLLTLLVPMGLVQGETQTQDSYHLTPHPAGCEAGEVYLSAQEWWVNANGRAENPQTGQAADDFGHIHTELCFPHLATVSGKITFQVKHVMHHNPGKFDKFLVQIFNRSHVKREPRLCHDDYAYACLRFSPPRTVDNCEATGGRYGDNHHTCVWVDNITIDTRDFPYDGWQQFRFRAFVEEPDGEDGRTSTGLHLKLKNGRPRQDAYPSDVDHLESRGWYGHEVNYTTTRLYDVPLTPVEGTWKPKIYLRPGSEGIPVTSHGVYVDANFHQDNQGWVIREKDGPFEGRVAIDTTRLANGWHRLVLKANALSEERGSTNSAVGAMLFEVDNDPPCQNDCLPALGESSSQITSPTIRINFQDEDAAVPAGYLPDTGRPYRDQHGYRYGWEHDLRYLAREREKTNDLRWDTLLHLPRWSEWEISLPDGTYEVTVGIGDPIYDKHYTIAVEERTFWDDKYLDNWEFRTKSREVTVIDGRLTISAANARNDRTQISFVIITPVTHHDNVVQVQAEVFIPVVGR